MRKRHALLTPAHFRLFTLMMVIPLFMSGCAVREAPSGIKPPPCNCSALNLALDDERKKRLRMDVQVEAGKPIPDPESGLKSDEKLAALESEVSRLSAENRMLQEQLNQLKDIEENINEHTLPAILPLDEEQIREDIDG